ncbi:MAG: tRNA dihydrouridine synthase DusB [Candidatus Latescibacteria bacterium]|nr:tRNA dihydrouridine synthase DusB [Candidatus Latescibacterota bacterium]
MDRIRNIFSRDHAALAPLAGVTASVFRRICVRFGARPVMTEMVSSDGLVQHGGSKKTELLLDYRESERPIGIQLFGSEPDIMAEAAAIALGRNPDFIDINAGCPVKKVVTRGAGSALLRDLPRLARIVEKIAALSAVPVTVKIRSGWDAGSINATEAARVCSDAGASAVIIHPRLRIQGFGGSADWSVIRAVREAVDIAVVGSGDIDEPEDALRMLNETGADAVMIGRRAMGDPWIFRRVHEFLSGRKVSPPPDTAERLDLALEQLDTLTEEVSERFAVLNMRKFFGWYSRGARNGAAFRIRVFRAGSRDEVYDIVHEFQEESREYDQPDEMMRVMV